MSEQEDDGGVIKDADKGSGLCSGASTFTNRISCFALANVTDSLGAAELPSPPTPPGWRKAESESDEDEKRKVNGGHGSMKYKNQILPIDQQ